jgi:seryl-tRNA synthetase
MRLPNILHESVPIGKDDTENVEVKRWGEPLVPAFDLKNHGALAVEQTGRLRTRGKDRRSRVLLLKGRLALLDMALQRFAMDLLVERGYTPYIPPYMMNRTASRA